MRFQVWGFLACWVLLCSSLASAAPDVTETRVNGYRVLLINLHQGNAFQLGVHVPTGAWHDEPRRHAGLAHLWEHIIHRSTHSFPDGEGQIAILTNRLGGNYNAYTANNLTYYHAYGNPAGLSDAMKYLGSMMSEPAWNQEHFDIERAVVMEEAGQYQARDGIALRGSMMLELLPVDHPFRMYDVGTQDQLKAVTLDDLRTLYLSNYTQERVTLVVAGNFDPLAGTPHAPLVQSEVLGLIAKSFHGPSDRTAPPNVTPGADQRFPPLRTAADRGKPYMSEIASRGGRNQMLVSFEIPEEIFASPHARETMETLLDYLNASGEGTLSHELKQRGWVTAIGGGHSEINNLHLVQFNVMLTESGSEQRRQIPDAILSALQQISAHAIDAKVLARLQRTNISSYEYQAQSPSFAAEQLSQHFHQFDRPADYFDFKARYGNISAEDIQRMAARAFSVDRMLVGYVGSGVESTERALVFDRPVIRVSDPALLARWRNVHEGKAAPSFKLAPRVSSLAFNYSEAPQKGLEQPARVLTSAPESSILLRESHANTLGGIAFQATFAPSSPRSVTAFWLYTKAFVLDHLTEIEELNSQNILGGFGFDGTGISLSVRGNSQAQREALQWILEKFKNYQPSPQALSMARQSILQSEAGRVQEFTANLSNQEMNRIVSLRSIDSLTLLKASKDLTDDDILRTSRRLLARTDHQWSFSGDFTAETATTTAKNAREILTQPLTPIQRDAAKQTHLPINRDLQFWSELPQVQKPTSIGLTRVYPGAPLLSDEHAASLPLVKALGAEIFRLNRAQRNLGYVHNASRIVNPNGSHITFYGQTDQPARWPMIAQGWGEVLARIKDRTLSEGQFADEILGTVRGSELLAVEPLADAQMRLAEWSAYGRLGASQELVKKVRALEPEQIYVAAEKMLFGQPYLEVTATHELPKNCRGAFQSINGAQRAIKSASTR